MSGTGQLPTIAVQQSVRFRPKAAAQMLVLLGL